MLSENEHKVGDPGNAIRKLTQGGRSCVHYQKMNTKWEILCMLSESEHN